jgi:hypothetical protein
VEELDAFIKRFPESSFNKGISKSNLCDLLDLYNPVNTNYDKVDERNDVGFPKHEIEEAIQLGLMTRIDISVDPVKYWSKFTKEELRDTGLEYNIRPAANKKKTIQKFLENNVPFPEVLARPAPPLKEVFLRFVDLYMLDVQQHTIHFHPRLLKELWLKISEVNDHSPIPEKVKQLLKSPYWMDSSFVVPAATSSSNWSNSAFTFQLPLPSEEPKFRQEAEDPNDAFNGPFYLKAREGSFDETFFKDASTGHFRFPDYTEKYTGMGYVCDKTNYKKKYPAVNDFSLDQMERNFITPEWEFRDLHDFIEDLPATYLREGLSGTRLKDIFGSNFQYINEGTAHAMHYELLVPNDPLIRYGFFEEADQSLFVRAKSWDAMSDEALAAICKENDIKPSKQKVNMIWELIDHNIPFPLTWYKPTTALIHYFNSFIDLFITDIRNSTDHFHPLYFASLWEELKDGYYNFKVNEKINDILSHPYWKDRLYRALQ